MRITRDFLLKTAQTRAAVAAYNDRSIVCIYLVGSLLQESPLLGNTADIDLVCVHSKHPRQPRELIRLSDELHIDLAHYSAELYEQPRHLRADPWLGSSLVADPKALHDDGHWFEFTQAGTASRFFTPEHTLERLRSLAAPARTAWLELSALPAVSVPDLLKYLKSVENIGNCVACFSGPPLTERRFWLEYPGRVTAMQFGDRPYALLANLFSPQPAPLDLLQRFTPDWLAALDAVAAVPACPVKLSPIRRKYYTDAEIALQEACPTASLWIMLRTWCLALAHLRSNSVLFKPFNEFRDQLGLGVEPFGEKLQALDAMLDALEETLDSYASANGLA
jgi:hypothetical protein